MDNQIRYYLRRLTLWYYNFRYSKYYPVVVPIFITAVGIIIFVVLILPQMTNWLSVQSEIAATQGRIDVMRQNSRILESLNKSDVDRDFAVVAQALPSDKDFIGILNAISKSALSSNITLNDYEFGLGAVSVGRDGKKSDIPSIPVSIGLTIEGSVDNFSKFMSEIERKFPLAEVKSLNYSEDTGEILVVFYMKPFTKQDLNYSDPIQSLDQEQRSILQVLYQWAGE